MYKFINSTSETILIEEDGIVSEELTPEQEEALELCAAEEAVARFEVFYQE